MISAGRLSIEQYRQRDGDVIKLVQTHSNGSDEEVGLIRLCDDEIEDAIYVLQRAKAVRDRELGR